MASIQMADGKGVLVQEDLGTVASKILQAKKRDLPIIQLELAGGMKHMVWLAPAQICTFH